MGAKHYSLTVFPTPDAPLRGFTICEAHRYTTADLELLVKTVNDELAMRRIKQQQLSTRGRIHEIFTSGGERWWRIYWKVDKDEGRLTPRLLKDGTPHTWLPVER